MYRKLSSKNLGCTGCGACVNICPVNAISYILDEKNGLIAQINEDKCIQCGKCEQVCPVLSEKINHNRYAESCYAVWADDETRWKSSSGGIFSVLAEEVLEQQGYVCGAAYNEKFQVEHKVISEKEDLQQLRRSKYVQSNIGYVFREIKNLLEQGKKVLFVGTPCQVAGLKAYLGGNRENLILVDIYCNFTPSPFIFKKYLDENYNLDLVDKIEFRVKQHGWVADIHTVIYKDQHAEEKREYNDFFQRGYHPKLFMKETCEKCRFAGNPRQGDLSIADFWYIGDFYPELDDKKGTSCVVINNEKGQAFFDSIKDRLQMCREVSIECMKYNRGATAKAHPGRDRFYELVKKTTFNRAVDYALNGKYDVAVWGNWSEKNYGSELTYYALYKILQKLNFDVLMVERPQNAIWGPNETVALFHENPYPLTALCPLYPNKVSMYELNKRCDTFIVGSDQIWHRNLYYDFGSVAFFDYIYNSKKKIAYASSFGRDYWSGSEAETQEAAFYLKEFDYISVREQSGVAICKDYFNVSAEWVLDPVFLCNKDNYIALAAKSKTTYEEAYIGGYILDIDDKRKTILDIIRQELHMPVRVITDAFKEEQNVSLENGMDLIQNASCEDWLANIINSAFVITDSFHGMCFAIIFHKPFIAIANEGRGIVRFTDLLEKLNLSEHLIAENVVKADEIRKLCHNIIRYDDISKFLDCECARSCEWLKNAIVSPKNYQITGYDILRKKIQENESVTNSISVELSQVNQELGNRKWDIDVHRKEINDLKWDTGVHRKELNEIKWDMSVHRKELNERKWDIDVHRKELNERKWDIDVHRKELDEHREDIDVHRKELEDLKKGIEVQLEILDSQKKEIEKMKQQIDNLNNCWIIRNSRYLIGLLKNTLRK